MSYIERCIHQQLQRLYAKQPSPELLELIQALEAGTFLETKRKQT